MRTALRLILTVVFCMGMASGVVVWATGGLDWWKTYRAAGHGAPARLEGETNPDITWYPDPMVRGKEARVFADRREMDRYIALHSFDYKGPIADPASLGEVREAVRMRGQRAIIALHREFESLKLGSPPTADQLPRAIPVVRNLAFFHMHEGEFDQAASWLERGLELSRELWQGEDIQLEFHALLGINALRRGEIENCLECAGPSSCIFPIDPAAVHHQQAGSREAVKQFTAYLARTPGDLRVRWLLNLAYMTLGEYPDKVPPAYLIPLDGFRSSQDVGRFDNVAPRVGLGVRGPNLAGGSVFDDFNGDDLPDLLTTSFDVQPRRLAVRESRRWDVREPIGRGRPRPANLRART